MADLDSKDEGDNSMPLNRLSCPGVWGEESGDPRDIGESLISLKPNLQWYKNMPTGKTSETGAGSLLRGGDVPAATSEAWTMPNEGIQGDEWAA